MGAVAVFEEMHRWWAVQKAEKPIGKPWGPKAPTPQPPVEVDRRQALRDRLAGFADVDRLKFQDLMADRGVDRDDLDAIEALIDEVDPFSVVVPPVEPKPVAVVEPRPLPELDDELTISDDDAEALRLRAQALPAEAQDILKWIVSSSMAAGCSLHMRERPSLRRWLILDAVLTHLSHGWDEDVCRTFVAMVTDDPSVEQPAIPIGAVLGALTIPQAKRLGEMTAALGS